jgi:bacterioferritin-associated ferredoxin
MSAPPTPDPSAIACHCRQVRYAELTAAIGNGAKSLLELQRRTTACTRCFGCRFEIEALLRNHLGDAYVETEYVTRGDNYSGDRRSRFSLRRKSHAGALPRRMYMPALVDYAGYDVDTRVIVFNWSDSDAPTAPVQFRADLLALDGRRIAVREAVVAPGASVVIDVRELADGDALSQGAGVVKLVVDAETLHSLRPYFHLVSPGGITSTHEKAGTAHPREFSGRPFHWLFPIGHSALPQEAYFFCLNTQERPMISQELVWQSEAGVESRIPLPRLDLDQAALVPLHETDPAIGGGTETGTVRLTPATHKVAGFMIRHEPTGDRWRIQHL